MQAVKNLTFDKLREIVEAVFAQGPVIVKEAYSEYARPIREFSSAHELLDDMSNADEKKSFFYYCLYYPEAKGFVYEKRIKLIPEKCKGHTFRFSQEGWGLIGLQCGFSSMLEIECRIAVNSSVRAENWKSTVPEHKTPSLWDWKIIEKKAGKLIRLLRKIGE